MGHGDRRLIFDHFLATGSLLFLMETETFTSDARNAVQCEQIPFYVRLKRRRDDPPPPFLCVLRPLKRQQLRGKALREAGVLERALIFRHVDSAAPPETSAAPESGLTLERAGEVQKPSSACEEHGRREPQGVKWTETLLAHTCDQDALVNAQEPCTKGEIQEAVVKSQGPCTIVESATFWSAFNTPPRPDVFGPFASSNKAPSTRLGYRDAVEEAVRSLRRFQIENHLQQGRLGIGGGNEQLQVESAVRVLEVCQDGSKSKASEAEQGNGEFEYDLYAIECDSGADSTLNPDVGANTHKQRLLELLQYDRSAVALIEVEDVDPETGVVTSHSSGMQVFLEEFGDIDDSDSGRAAHWITQCSYSSSSFSRVVASSQSQVYRMHLRS